MNFANIMHVFNWSLSRTLSFNEFENTINMCNTFLPQMLYDLISVLA